ncbi:MAG: hypothetical protein QOK11_1033 [Pseudonocardiales bacterium]|nr:hypothetical protein [Pseudonocardiales bacterium]
MRLGGDFGSHYELGQEYNEPHYRVSFWTGTSEEWVEIYEADIDEVLGWVHAAPSPSGREYGCREVKPKTTSWMCACTELTPHPGTRTFRRGRGERLRQRAIPGQHGRREKRSVLPVTT